MRISDWSSDVCSSDLQHNGFGAGLPATLVTALLGGTDSQGVIPGVPWNPDSEQLALEAVQKAGWTPISASQLGYTGKVDGRGTFFGEKAGYTTAQRSEEHTSELQSLMRSSYAVFCLK